ncbi:MAG: VWA domain-containing protein [Armatimonadetes bacterium]|nr:VWA domain-containing protein [Armatimonadota bacterium]MDW8152931.1 VWA domain-containing protein [Armatimonadota bacterium]
MIRFSFPPALLLLLLLPFLWRASRPFRVGLALLLRTVALGLVVLALAGMQLLLPGGSLSVVFVLDRSDSVPPEEAARAERFLAAATRFRQPGDRLGLVTFGGKAVVEQVPTDRFDPSPTLRPHPVDTDIQSALELALAVLPQEGGRRLVLLSDGLDLRGGAMEAARRAAAAGVPIFTVPLQSVLDRDGARVQDLLTPATVRAGERFQVQALVWSSRAQRARLELSAGGRLVASRELRLSAGWTAVSFFLTGPQGWLPLRVRLLPEQDGVWENNVAEAVVRGHGAPTVLYVGSGDLPRLLRAQGLRVEEASPERLPGNAASLVQYEAVILEDLPAHRLSQAQMESLRTYVASLGGGLVVVGGTRAFGPGGYAGTPLEEVLPVSMDVRHRVGIVPAAVVLVLDTSASMAGLSNEPAKVELAKEAARSVLDFLGEQDLIGIIAFDQEYRWLVPLTPVRERDRIEERIARLRTGGGTDMWPALRGAAEALRGVRARVKHVIALSDGQTDPGDFQGLALQMRAAGITLSAVSVGRDADVAFMRRLAEWGGGRHYHARDPYTVPQLLTAEVTVTRRAYFVEERFVPRRTGTAFLSGVPTIPPLRGYVATSPKPAAQVHLVSPHGDPLLATWQYGLGRAAAFTSDGGLRWAPEWRQWSYSAAFWSRVVRWAMRPSLEPLEVRVHLRGAAVEAVVDARDAEGNPLDGLTVVGTLVGPQTQRIRFVQTGPGWYEAHLQLGAPGTYAVTVSAFLDGRRVGSASVPVLLPYSPELRSGSRGISLLERIAETTGGRVVHHPAEVLRRDPSARTPRNLADLLVSVALCLLLGEVASRRIPTLQAAWQGLLARLHPWGTREEDRAYEEADRWRFPEEALPASTEALTRLYILRLRQSKDEQEGI